VKLRCEGCKIESNDEGLTEFAEIEGRGHSLTIDHGW